MRISDGLKSVSAAICAAAEDTRGAANDVPAALPAFTLPASAISDITALSTLPNLQRIYLNANQIEDISPLASLKKLSYLNLNRNQISDFTPISTMRSLKEVSLNHNRGVANVNLLRSQYPTIRFNLSDEEVCASENQYLQDFRLLDEEMLDYVHENKLVPVYAKPGNRYSGINLLV